MFANYENEGTLYTVERRKQILSLLFCILFMFYCFVSRLYFFFLFFYCCYIVFFIMLKIDA